MRVRCNLSFASRFSQFDPPWKEKTVAWIQRILLARWSKACLDFTGRTSLRKQQKKGFGFFDITFLKIKDLGSMSSWNVKKHSMIMGRQFTGFKRQSFVYIMKMISKLHRNDWLSHKLTFCMLVQKMFYRRLNHTGLIIKFFLVQKAFFLKLKNTFPWWTLSHKDFIADIEPQFRCSMKPWYWFSFATFAVVKDSSDWLYRLIIYNSDWRIYFQMIVPYPSHYLFISETILTVNPVVYVS